MQTPIIPDGWTFGVVWSTIYAGTAAYAIHQALPSQQNNPRFRNAAPWLAISYVLNAIFGRLFSDPRTESMIGSDIVTKASLPVALALHNQLENRRNESRQGRKNTCGFRSVCMRAG
jgi:tryptophan-rich sensory protein